MKVRRKQHKRSPTPLIPRSPRGRNDPKIKPGTPYRATLASVKIADRFGVITEYALHATKGYRAIQAW